MIEGGFSRLISPCPRPGGTGPGVARISSFVRPVQFILRGHARSETKAVICRAEGAMSALGSWMTVLLGWVVISIINGLVLGRIFRRLQEMSWPHSEAPSRG